MLLFKQMHWYNGDKKKLKLDTIVGELIWNPANGRKPWMFDSCCNKCTVTKWKCDCVRWSVVTKAQAWPDVLEAFVLLPLEGLKKNYIKYKSPKQVLPALSCFADMVCPTVPYRLFKFFSADWLGQLGVWDSLIYPLSWPLNWFILDC